MTELKNNILDKIKKGEVSQKSRWYFVTRDYFFWLITAVAILIGSLAFASIAHQIKIGGTPLSFKESGFATDLFLALPIIWIVIFVALVAVAWYNYRNTTRAYRHQNSFIVAAVLLLSLVLGSGLFFAGLGKEFDERSRKQFPLLQKRFEERKERREEFRKQRQERLKKLNPEERLQIQKEIRTQDATLYRGLRER